MTHSHLALRATRALLATAAAALLLSACGGGSSTAPVSTAATPAAPAEVPVPGDRAALGRMIFNDANLSEPRGTACVACHQANQGFAGNHGSMIGVALGSTPGALGLRNAMTNAYSGFVPSFAIKTANGETEASGGHFWDGRADTLALQALGPLLNPLEMNNASRQAVVDKIAASAYAPLFKQEFGAGIFSNTDAAFTQIGVAIDAFERADLQPFTAKYDHMVKGAATFTPAESRGMALFQDPAKGNCAACHLMNPGSANPQDSLFSEFTYYATGVPRNTAIPRNADPAFFDLGLCGPERTAPVIPADVVPGVTLDNFCGKFRMPTLRNVAQRPAFMHNGVFRDLRDVLRFYAGRNTSTVSNDLPSKYQANVEVTKPPFNRTPAQGPALTEAEISDVIAFLRTLSDGYTPP
jgi:cytochrome c peroxidase